MQSRWVLHISVIIMDINCFPTTSFFSFLYSGCFLESFRTCVDPESSDLISGLIHYLIASLGGREDLSIVLVRVSMDEAL